MQTSMDSAATALLDVGIGVFAAASLWFIAVAARTKWWWPLSFPFVAPILAFAYLERRSLKGAGLLLLVSIGLLFAGLVAHGDLIEDRHPEEPPTRTFMQRAFGCSGAGLQARLRAADDKPIEDWLGSYRFYARSLESDFGIARMAVHAAALSYLPAERIAANRFAFPLATTIPITVGADQAVVIANEHLVVVAFRGTDNAENWVRNFNFLPAKTAFGPVHAGFLEAFRALWPDVARSIAALRDKNQPIWLTGHSLGGAIALLAAAELQRAALPIAGIVTFGQPPVGASAFAKRLMQKPPGRLLRYVNHTDAVVAVSGPLLVPWLWLEHTGNVRYFDTTGRLHDGTPPWLQLLRDKACAPTFEGGAELGAHYVRRYLDLVSSSGGSPS